MAVMLLAGGLIVVVAMFVATFIVLKTRTRAAKRIEAQEEAWERAQMVRQQQWEKQQEQQSKEVAQIQQLRAQEKDQALASTVAELQQQRKLFNRARVECELARLRRLEDIPLPVRLDDPTYQPGPDWEPLRLPGADLAGRDLSSYYIRHADLRAANLSHANLFMADLSWACLADADLTGADLSAANLQYADLRGAQLSEARFLVSDLQHSNLAGANLLQAYSLSSEQLATCHVDQNTQLDEHISPPISSAAHTSPLPLLAAAEHTSAAAADNKVGYTGSGEENNQRETPEESGPGNAETPLPEGTQHKDAVNPLAY